MSLWEYLSVACVVYQLYSSINGGKSSSVYIKYAPTSLQEVIGNKKVIESLQNWLERWEDVHIKSI